MQERCHQQETTCGRPGQSVTKATRLASDQPVLQWFRHQNGQQRLLLFYCRPFSLTAGLLALVLPCCAMVRDGS